MRRFNPEKELYKIQHGNKNKILYGIILLLLIISIGSTYALYQVRYSKRIIYTKVAPFNNKDINLSVYWDDTEYKKFPDRGSGYIYDYTECDNDSEVKFNTSLWKLDVRASGPDKCDVHFKKVYKDNSGANYPELYQGLIPVYFDSTGKVKVANLINKWYDYENAEWANAVLINAGDQTTKDKYFSSDGSLKTDMYDKEIPMDDILQMYVWVPRYKYKLFNAKNVSTPKQVIEIAFEKGGTTTGTVTCKINNLGQETCENAENGNWYTHPAFSFGNNEDLSLNTKLLGIWVGKFETSGNINAITIKPNIGSIINLNVKTMFDASRNIELQYYANYNLNNKEVDTHMMKNMEWGAVAYLSQSKYGIYEVSGETTTCRISNMTKDECEIWINNSGTDNVATITGCSGSSVSAGALGTATCTPDYEWNKNGVNASTSGNMYGVYDMSGGKWEYVMADLIQTNGNFMFSASNFNTGFSYPPEPKYIDGYMASTNNLDQARGHLGDATREIMSTFGSKTGAWNGDQSFMPVVPGVFNANYWFVRSHDSKAGIYSGIFALAGDPGDADNYTSFRITLTAEDENT